MPALRARAPLNQQPTNRAKPIPIWAPRTQKEKNHMETTPSTTQEPTPEETVLATRTSVVHPKWIPLEIEYNILRTNIRIGTQTEWIDFNKARDSNSKAPTMSKAGPYWPNDRAIIKTPQRTKRPSPIRARNITPNTHFSADGTENKPWKCIAQESILMCAHHHENGITNIGKRQMLWV